MHRRLLATLTLLIIPAAVMVACGGDDRAKTPMLLQDRDRDQIGAKARDYITALHDQDVERALGLLPEGVPDASVKNAIKTMSDQGPTSSTSATSPPTARVPASPCGSPTVTATR